MLSGSIDDGSRWRLAFYAHEFVALEDQLNVIELWRGARTAYTVDIIPSIRMKGVLNDRGSHNIQDLLACHSGFQLSYHLFSHDVTLGYVNTKYAGKNAARKARAKRKEAYSAQGLVFKSSAVGFPEMIRF